MKKLYYIFLLLISIQNGVKANFAPSIVPEIIVDLASEHVHQNMSDAEKCKCLVVKDYLYSQTRYFLIKNPGFISALEQFSLNATHQNCEEILNQLAIILYGKSAALNKNQYFKDYDYIKSMLFNRHISIDDRAYLRAVINGYNSKQYAKNSNLLWPLNDKTYQPVLLSIKPTKDILLKKTISDIISQKIKDALTPSSKEDLKNVETIYKYIVKKTANWLYNFKNLVK